MRLFGTKKTLAAVVAGSFVFAFTVSSQATAAPVKVASIAPSDVGNGNCDFDASALGRGSASDPFEVGSAVALAEMVDCSSSSDSRREKVITGASGDGTTVTFLTEGTHGSYGVGQVVSIKDVDPMAYNLNYVRVISATDTSFTVASTVEDTYLSGGTVSSQHDFYVLTADIDLSNSNESWNDTEVATITSALGDGTTVTYTAANDFAAGETVSIKGMDNNDFNLGSVTVDTATSTEFTVANSATGSAGGGTASRPGWDNFDLYDVDIDGKDFTISGLTIDNPNDNQGLFERVLLGNIENLNLTGVDIDTTGRNTSGDYAGGIAGRLEGVGVKNVTVEGGIIGTDEYVGLLAGSSEEGNIRSVTTSGTINFDAIIVSGNNDGSRQPKRAGGLVGYASQESYVDVHSSVTVNGVNEFDDGVNQYTVYGTEIGGLIGSNNYSGLRDSSASGDVTGGNRVGGAVGQDRCCSYTVDSSASGDVFAYSNVPTSSWWEPFGAEFVGGFYGEEGCCSTRLRTSASGDVYVEVFPEGGNVSYVGGLIGYYGCCGAIIDSLSTGDVTVVNNSDNGSVDGYSRRIGGFIGEWDCCADIVGSHSTGDVNVTGLSDGSVEDVGGFIGVNQCCGTVRYSYATGNVNIDTAGAVDAVGGFIGRNNCCGAIIGTYATGDVAVDNGVHVGGHTGYSDYAVQYLDSYAEGDVTVTYDGRVNAGAFVGYQSSGGEFTRVHATGNVAASPVTPGGESTAVGGLVGYAYGETSHFLFTDSYYRGSLSGTSDVGGLIGELSPEAAYKAERVYVAADVTATDADGVSDPVATGNWIDNTDLNFFDSDVAGTEESEIGFNARTTAQMKTQSNYADKGWLFSGDANPWRMAAGTNEGYPYLVPVVTADQGGGETWTHVKTLRYSGSKVALTKAKKRALRQGATALIADGCTKVQLRSRPNVKNYDAAIERVKRAHRYLSRVLDNRGSDLVVVSNVRIRPNTVQKNTVQLYCGK